MTIILPQEILKIIKINKYHTSILQIDDFKIYSDGKKYDDLTTEVKKVISKHNLRWIDCKIYVMPHSLMQVDKKEAIVGGAYQGRVIKDNVFISATCKDIEDTLIHELGHVIGYKHFHPNLFTDNAHYTEDYKLFKKIVGLNNDNDNWYRRPCESLAEHFKYIYLNKSDFDIHEEAIELIKKYIPKVEVLEVNKPDKIIIDAGHGGKDSGGGTNQHWKEKDFVLTISKYQYDRFKQLGIDVEMTRFDDTYLGATDRTNIVKGSNATICISNHINAGGGEGVETIHSIHNNGKLAKMIYAEIVLTGQKGRRVFSKEGKNGDYYYMHRDTGNVETVIVEYGFADNERDTQKLLTNWRDYAEAVVKSVCEYINVEYKEPLIPTENVTEEPVIPTENVTWQEFELDQAISDGRINTPKYWLDKWEDNIKVKDVIGLVLKLTRKTP